MTHKIEVIQQILKRKIAKTKIWKENKLGIPWSFSFREWRPEISLLPKKVKSKMKLQSFYGNMQISLFKRWIINTYFLLILWLLLLKLLWLVSYLCIYASKENERKIVALHFLFWLFVFSLFYIHRSTSIEIRIYLTTYSFLCCLLEEKRTFR